MLLEQIKPNWQNNYSNALPQLEKIKNIKSVITAFNANIDAVVKIDTNYLQKLALDLNFQINDINNAERSIKSEYDIIRGIIKCFASGNAEEWLIDSPNIFSWVKQQFGSHKLQLGGQGGIVANALAVCGIKKVFAHSASLPKEQSNLFLDLPNLISTDEKGLEKKACDINRKDIPLIHWIFEFNTGDKITINKQEIICPKSNRFIATYDPLNFCLHIDEPFSELVTKYAHDYIILSGYHLLREKNALNLSGISRIKESLAHIAKWRKQGNPIVHLEVASTQDETIRKYIFENVIKNVDSIGLNDREAIDLLQIADETNLAESCNQNPSVSNLFNAIYTIFKKTACPRIQLHMYGIYITIQKKNFRISPEANLKGMMLASIVAASKAQLGNIDNYENLTSAKNLAIDNHSLKQIIELASFLKEHFGENNIMTTGIYTDDNIEIIAVPTILIAKPVTLVGMGDTISSISLVAAI